MRRLILFILLLSSSARADGIVEFLAPPDPCWDSIFAIEEEDVIAQQDRVDFLCGTIPTVVALDQNYTPGHDKYYWDEPPLLPPAPIPLPAAGWMMVTALLILAGFRKNAA